MPLASRALAGLNDTVIHVRSILLALMSALLLASEHAAVTHALWHQAHDAVGHHSVAAAESGDTHEHDDGAGALCDFHALLGQLLDGGSAAASPCVLPARVALPAPTGVRHLLAVHDIQPRARGPPVLL